MQPTQDNYPVFEANQVLTNAHLNQIFNYLDEQERLSRANLIGIGIVCDLEIRLDIASATSIHLTKGCGVTSEGYLIVEPEESTLVSYRPYTVPDDIDYPTFEDDVSHAQYPLWELFPEGEPGTTLLHTPSSFLNDKAFLLFLELKKEGLRNCSPNNCDDKGTEVTATVRKLLIKKADLTKIIAKSNQLESGLTGTDLETLFSERLNLPDIRLPRFNVPSGVLTNSSDVYSSFLKVFSQEQLVHTLENALSAAYAAFKPVVFEKYVTDPFTSFISTFGFLETAPVNQTQVRFLPYYHDFFDDLINAYNEFRWKGLELLCACVPSEKLFPRHLMLGLVKPAPDSAVFRQNFLASSALSGCEGLTEEVQLLFQRLVEMISRFSNTPALPQTGEKIRITPSKLGDVPLSSKAIPYYYLQNGTPPLYNLWSSEKTRRKRANHNLGYRSTEYVPAAPSFVTNPLKYDLEPHNFLRIEGHLGQQYQTALKTLIGLKNQYRLPVEFIALRAGSFDENIPLDLAKDKCHFQDLEAIYDSLREELLRNITEGILYLYKTPVNSSAPEGTVKVPLLVKYAAGTKFAGKSAGAFFEANYNSIKNHAYVDFDQKNVNGATVLYSYCSLFPNNFTIAQEFYAHIVSIYYLVKLSELLPANLDLLQFSDFQNKYEDLVALSRFIRDDIRSNIPTELAAFIPKEDLLDYVEEVLFSCKLDAFKAIYDEYLKRLKDLKKQQFLSYFLTNNPGIQHKSGVPLGGTFILVYHQEPTSNEFFFFNSDFLSFNAVPATNAALSFNSKKAKQALPEAISYIKSQAQYASDPAIQLLLGAAASNLGNTSTALALKSAAEIIIENTVEELANGAVIADFFLPYICCSDCSPIQFVLPKPPPLFTYEQACPDIESKSAEVTIEVKGQEPFSIKVDDAEYADLKNPIRLSEGPHTVKVKDGEGIESAAKTITIPPHISIGEVSVTCNEELTAYVASFSISGGSAPYQADGSMLEGAFYQSPSIPKNTQKQVVITDSNGCSQTVDLNYDCVAPCTLPCDGNSTEGRFRLWLQPSLNVEDGYTEYQITSEIVFNYVDENDQSQVVNLDKSVLSASTDELNKDFHKTFESIAKKLNEAVAKIIGENRLIFSYEPTKDTSFQSLKIEYFDCEKFSVRFDYAYATRSIKHNLHASYTNANFETEYAFVGVQLYNEERWSLNRIPAFGFRTRNQCLNTGYEEKCKGMSADPSFKVTQGGNWLNLEYNGNLPEDAPLIAFVWDIVTTSSEQPFYSGKSVQISGSHISDQVILTVIDSNGCFRSFSKKPEIDKN